jgi:glutamine cyclotransferase
MGTSVCRKVLIGMAVALILAAVCVAAALLPAHRASARQFSGSPPPKWHEFHIVRELHHDPSAFTQGLQFDKGRDGRPIFWESTGMYGRSEVREVCFPSMLYSSRTAFA